MLSQSQPWPVQGVVHSAARVHVMQERAADPLAEFRRSNVAGTLALARQAVSAGVRRFVFISSIKVHGEQTTAGRPFTAADAPAPADPYAISKLEAELALLELARETGLELVILRPPLVYGPGVGANFQRLIRWVRRGTPLPLGSIDNRRSLVGVHNLADLAAHSLTHPAAPGRAWLATDDEDVSTPELLRRLGAALQVPVRLMRVPVFALRAAGTLLGQGAALDRLCQSLQADIADTRRLLAWNPPETLDEGLARTVKETP